MLPANCCRRLLVFTLLLAPWWMLMAGGQETSAQKKPKTVRLVIDYNDGVEKHFTRLAWAQGMSVLDAMNQAKQSPHGISFRHRGKGATAFLTEIDDLENQGGGKKNWMFRVNDQPGKESFGIAKLMPDDVARWTFQDRSSD